MKVAVTGTGITKFGELWDKSFANLAEEAAGRAVVESTVEPQKIDAVFCANMLSGNLSGQNHLGALITSILNINSPAYTIEAACASGGVAANLAYQAILSGSIKNALIIGVEKMTDYSTAEVATGLMGAAAEDERDAALTFPGLYAIMANAHMEKYKTTKKHMAAVAVKNHRHGSLNENAQYQNLITIEKVLESAPVATPLNLFDCSPITDGAAAIILSAVEDSSKKVTIAASSVATDKVGLAKRKSITELLATKIASQNAYQMAGISEGDVDVAEVHDCFTIAEILAMEDLGFCKKGDGGKFVSSGITEIGAKKPTNTSGGLKACGHPVGATGIKQIIEITKQLKGEAGKRQVKGAKIGLTHNVGGSGATAAIHILRI
ncbi:hypothetical protein A2870_02565 [Candidatus Curtissbacteria bacterium RIFCSPHIGHO2_01_FULL_41_11]|uniref:Acetyl-CoA acetyltransferase n=1 Tax=Candidatus Curtissbacteria bacterium RIFCSPHIGHO2_01_FULL_41_11 TaxID=1797711 RepID=A0A1F5G8J5_9BACT|nr:MAG: hypothetical protein A2870_02565 [Candidatus Curtissbacteria bacterium RIFCSPHIGHO2_01_FULL_41_11]